ncbi:hypothetical protein [Nocardia wallacei]|uniref:Mce-associated membrane protein n=1 Tax=Nocardia wallacei TaxID=480035 RepID=A0A7G1KFD7_9NOCA|nr:hypothetical protein [Nocardia wallacei]BCK52779.1 hypothetical protein NWFMUON74_05510 [Nocardia wallacei]
MSENTRTPGRARRRVVRSAGPPAANARATEIVAETSAAAPPGATPAGTGKAAPVANGTAESVVNGTAESATAKAESIGKGQAGAAAEAAGAADTVRLGVADVEKARATSAAETVRTASVDAGATQTTVRGAGVAHDGQADADTVRLGAADAETVRLGAGTTPGAVAYPGTEKKTGLGWLGWIAAVVAVLSALVLLGSGGFFVYHQRHADALDARRADYAQTAKQAVLNLTNIKDDTAPQDIDRVLAVASGQLKAEYSERKDAYAQVVQQAKVKASGEIIETAIESEDDHSARVLIAAKQTLTNAASADPQQRYYRFRVTVARGGDGQLTASQVEFVA